MLITLCASLLATQGALAAMTWSAQAIDVERDPIVIGGAVQPGTSASQSASAKYNKPVSQLVVFEATESAFNQIFGSAYKLYVVYDTAWWPWTPHVMAHHTGSDVAFDLSKDYAALMQHKGVSILAPSAARDHAFAYMAAANAELVGARYIVDSSHSELLERPISNVYVQFSGTTWNVTATTWSPTNGVIADWYVQFSLSSVQDSVMHVTHVRKGPHETHGGDPLLKPGDRIRNQYTNGYVQSAGNGAAKLLFRDQLTFSDPVLAAEAFAQDGTRWVAYWPGPITLPSAAVDDGIAQAAVAAGVEAYETIVYENHASCSNATRPTSWGFHANDTDCTYEIHLLPENFTLGGQPASARSCGACVTFRLPQSACESSISMGADYASYQQSMGRYQSKSLSDIVTSVITHEFFHVLQCETIRSHAAPQALPVLSPAWETVIEGQARFVQSLIRPSAEHAGDSQYYSTNGAEGLVLQPWTSLCERRYQYAPFWTYVAVNSEGGTIYERASRTMRRALEEMGSELPTTELLGGHELNRQSCQEALAGVLDEVLGATPGLPSTLNGTLENMSLDVLSRTRFTWADANGTERDWANSTLLDSVNAEPINATRATPYTPGSVMPSVEDDVNPWGSHYFWLNKTRLDLSSGSGEVFVSCGASDLPTGWSLRLVNLTEGNAIGDSDVQRCSGAALRVDLRDAKETYLVALRNASTSGTYELTVSEVP